jgi:hypothetical protein
MQEQVHPVVEVPRKNNNTIIIIAVIVVALCCCCIGLWAAWTYGDIFVQELNF